jgi:histidinol-phosphate aminotransferase
MLAIRKNIRMMAGYVPGFQPTDNEQWIKLNTNENPFPPSPHVVEAIRKELGDGTSLSKYPDPPSSAGRQAAADLYCVDPEKVILANGSDELLNNLIRAFTDTGDEIGMVQPSYSYYVTLAEIQGVRVSCFELDEEWQIEDFPEKFSGKLFFLTSPNSPLGVTFDNRYISELADRCEGVLVVDEAYADFADKNALGLLDQHDNIIITRTLSKSYSLAGMRLGLAIGPVEVIRALDKIRDHYNIDRLAQAAATAALQDQDHLQSCVSQICAIREWFSSALREIGYSVIPSQANFVYATPSDRNGQRVYDGLFARKILVRYFPQGALSSGLRISIGSRSEMETCLSALKEIG